MNDPWNPSALVRTLLALAPPVGALCSSAGALGAQVTEVIDATGDGIGGDFLSGTIGLSVGPDGTTFVAGLGSDNVFRVSPRGEISELLRMEDPGVLAVDPHSGDLIVASYVNLPEATVFRLTPAGEVHLLLDSTGDGRGNELVGPSSIDIGPDGSVFVTGGISDNLFRVGPGGSVEVLLDASGDGESEVDTPVDVAVGADGVAYVACHGSDNVFAVTPDGTVTRIADGSGDGEGNQLEFPLTIDVDSLGRVYVGSGAPANGRVFRISPNGVVKLVLDSSGDGVIPFRCPNDVAVDASDAVLVAGGCSENVFKIHADGTLEEVLSSAGGGPGSELSHARLLAFGPNGELVVASGGDDYNVLRIETTGEVTELLDREGDRDFTGFEGVGDTVAAGFGLEGELFLLGRNLFRARPGEQPVLISREDAGGSPFSEAFGVAVDSAGRVVFGVGNFGSFFGRVLRLELDGSVTTLLDSTGDGVNPFAFPRDMALDSSDNLYVAGAWATSLLLRVASDGTVTQVLDGAGGVGDVLGTPDRVAVDSSGAVYLTGSVSDKVARISPAGVIDVILDGDGDGVGNALDGPGGIAIDGAHNVYVASSLNDRVFRVSPSGVVDTIIKADGDGEHALDEPTEVAVGPRGEVYVGGASSNNVFRIEPDGSIELVFGPPEVGLPPLRGLSDLAVDPATGDVLVGGGESDNVFLIEAPPCASLPRVIFRNGGANPPSYTATPGSIGGTMWLRVNLTTTGHAMASVFAFDTAVEVPLAGGQTLLTLGFGTGLLLDTGLHSGPYVVIELDVPDIPALVGATIHTQALHAFGVAPFALSNAQEIVIGSCP